LQTSKEIFLKKTLKTSTVIIIGNNDSEKSDKIELSCSSLTLHMVEKINETMVDLQVGTILAHLTAKVKFPSLIIKKKSLE
jgi:hypothetical protein